LVGFLGIKLVTDLKGSGKKVFRPVGTSKEKKGKAIKLHA
jgi:hypothetical protein